MPYNFEPPYTLAIAATGRQYIHVGGAGGASIQVQATTSLAFTTELTNDKSVFSQCDASVQGVPQGIGTSIVPSANDIVEVGAGGMQFIVLNVSAGTGTLSIGVSPTIKMV